MHICRSPTETLLGIFTFINEDKALSRATLASLARTSKKFKEPALDVFWKHIDGLEPLISCVIKRKMYGKGDIRRRMHGKLPPFAREGRILGQYAEHIRSLSITPQDLYIEASLVDVLVSAMSPTLLPNLRRLHWLDNGEDQFPLSHYLLVSPITLMKLRPASWWTPSSTKSTLLTSLGTSRCPTIRELECVYQGDDSEFSDVICEAVCGLRELSHLRTGVLNPRALLHLASLPSLKCQYSRTYNYNSTQTNATPTFRAQLDQVDISSQSPSVLARCLGNIQFLSCRSVELYIGNADQIHSALPHGPLGIPELIISLSEYFSPTLERLSVTLFNKLPEPTLADLRSPYTFDVIAPLLSFSSLKKSQLDWLCTLAIDDASFKIMAQSLPQLEEFYFGSRACWLIQPSITFMGLVHLIQYCRRLETIYMTLTPTR